MFLSCVPMQLASGYQPRTGQLFLMNRPIRNIKFVRSSFKDCATLSVSHRYLNFVVCDLIILLFYDVNDGVKKNTFFID